jgi:serine/threonine-protein kinase
MNTTDSERVKQLLGEALERSAGERCTFLQRACAGDAALREEVESLLTAYERAPTSFDRPILELSGAEHGSGLAPPVTLDHDLTGIRLGPYRLMCRLGAGGMGVVWQGERADGLHNRTVAVKIVHDPSSRAGWTRFVNEQATLASLDHPYIAKLLDAGMSELGLPYLVMEYVDGTRIDAYCDERRLAIGERLQLFVKVCEAVQYAHRKLVVHRDLKPANIFIGRDGLPKLLDFGIAKLLSEDRHGPDAPQTMRGVFTPQYASPEQIRGESVTTATDVYSLGVVLYELLTGRRFRQADAAGRGDLSEERIEKPSRALLDHAGSNGRSAEQHATLDAVATARGGNPERIRRSLAGDVDMIVLTALRHEPQRRYSTVEQLAEDIRRHLDHRPVTARSDTWGYRARKFARRNRALVAASVIAILGLVSTTIGTSMGLAHARTAQREAEQQAATREAVAEFYNIQLLGRANPSIAKGKDPTIREVLHNAAQAIPGKYPDQPLAEASVRVTVAQLYFALDELEEAESHARPGLELYQTHLGKDHQLSLRALNTLAEVLTAQSRWAEAEPLAREALERRRRVFGEEHVDTFTSLNNVAALHALQGRAAPALRLFEQACGLAQRLHGPQHTDTLSCLCNLTMVVQQAGRHAEAEQRYTDLLETSRRILGEDDAFTLRVTNNFGAFHVEQKRPQEGMALLLPTLEARRRILGKTHTDTLMTLHNVARASADTGDLNTALALYEEFFETAPGNLPARHPLWGVARGNYAASLVKLERYDEAEKLLLDGYDHLRTTLGERNPRTAKLASGLADLYDRWGRPDRAEQWRTKRSPPKAEPSNGMGGG